MKRNASEQQQSQQTPDDLSLEEQIAFFTSETSSRKVRNNVELSVALGVVENVAKTEGLTTDKLAVLLDVALTGKFANTTSSKLIKCLLPKTYIAEKLVLKCLSWICTGKAANEVQVMLMKWMVLTFDLWDSSKQVQALYGVIFSFIENDLLCPHVCHLLYKLTRKDDVVLFRIQRLLNLQKRVGAQPHLMGLLKLYKVYAPHLVVISVPTSRTVFFRATDRKLMADIREAQERIRQAEGTLGADITEKSEEEGRKVSKRRRLDVIPSVSSAAVTGGESLADLTLLRSHIPITPAEQIRSFEELLDNLDRIELPGQIASVLKSPVLQHVIACCQEEQISQRLGFWLYETLHEEIVDQPRSDRARGERFLRLLINFTEFLQEGVPACENFLVRYLHTWNGADYRPQILKLVSRFRLYAFPKLNDLILEPLRKIFFCSSVFCKCQIVHTLTLMLRNFITEEIPRYKAKRGMTGLSNDGETSDESSEEVDFCHTIEEFISFVDKISVVALIAEKDHILLFHHILTFYEMVSKLRCRYQTPYVCIPSAGIVYRALLSTNAVVISRMCNIMCNYHKEFSSWKEASAVGDVWKGTRSLIPPFNQYVLDFSNILWRNKAFKETQRVADPFLSVVPNEAVERTLVDGPNDGLSVLRHVGLLGYAYQFLKETQPEHKKLHPNLIQPHNRDLYLDYLQKQRLDGILAFIHTYIKRTAKK
ncbi:centromere protein I-like isoform X1 [Apostichopus japonicus]|uniref:centromere protein I-like isoform X1 n=1 Tax=Stichopus japonicus TaxID=307972 RepID=UPI003AB70FAD